MKTLYININGKDIQSTDSIEVIGSAEDNLVYGFYYSLGAEILRRVNTSSIGKITKSSLVEDFAKEKPEEYKAIEIQWEKLKAVLLGENPEGVFNVTLPNDYIDWLRYSDNQALSEMYTQKFQDKKNVEVAIDVEELYEESVDLLRIKAVRFLQNNDNYKNFDQLIVNDNLVERKSKLVQDIKNKFKDVEDFDVAFIRFEKSEGWKTRANVQHLARKISCQNNVSASIVELVSDYDIQAIIHNMYVYGDGKILVKNDLGLFGYIDELGKEVISCIYEDAIPFSSIGLAWVKTKKATKWSVIDGKGTIVNTVESNCGIMDYNGSFIETSDGIYKITGEFIGNNTRPFERYSMRYDGVEYNRNGHIVFYENNAAKRIDSRDLIISKKDGQDGITNNVSRKEYIPHQYENIRSLGMYHYLLEKSNGKRYLALIDI